MKAPLRWVLTLAAAALLAGGGAWLWNRTMVKRVEAVHDLSQALRDNPALAATRLLERHGHPVRTRRALDPALLRQPPDGTLIVLAGTLDTPQAKPLLAWAERGNTLIVRPAWVPEDDEPTPGADPVGERFGVTLQPRRREDEACRTLAPPASKRPRDPKEPGLRLVCVTPPGYPYALELDPTFQSMHGDDTAEPLWADTHGVAVRVYRAGRGHVVLLSTDLFSGQSLRTFDHGELLLVLARLAGPRAPVTIVQSTEATTWAVALWRGFAPALCAAAVLVLLWGWAAARRFGPLLPEPDGVRRALVEHIEASGRWLWQVPGGRALLLQAVRDSVAARLARRAPELSTLEPAERLRQLADRTGLPAADLERALHGAPARRPADFVHQIATLQTLREHHER